MDSSKGGRWHGRLWFLVPTTALLTVIGLAFASSLVLGGTAGRSAPTCGGKKATIVGTPGSDRITGTAGRDVIVAGADDDLVRGKGGADVICGSDGNDRVSGAAGADSIDGGRGGDRLEGGSGDDRLAGGAGADSILAGRGDDQLAGASGDDVLRGDAGNDRLSGGPGTDRCTGGGGKNVIKLCEPADRAAVAPPGAPTPPTPSTPPTPPTTPAPPVVTPPVDQAPVAASDSATVGEDGGARDVPVLANDSDPDGGPKTIASVTQPANGGVQITGGGTGVSYEPDRDYCNDPPGAATDDFTYSLAPGGSSASVAMTVSCVNDVPIVTTTAGSLAYEEGEPATAVDPGLALADADSILLASATAEISGGFEPGDVLEFTDQSGISGAYSSATGVLTLSGAALLSDYQAALRSVRFRQTGDDPAPTRTVTYRASDAAATGAAATRGIQIAAVNDAPAVASSGTALPYTENGGPIAIDGGLTVTDPDSTQLSGATVKIASSFRAMQDELGFTDQLGITGAYDDGTGVLALTGLASVAAYQTALRSVTYANASDAPAPLVRTISFEARDAGLAASNVATRGVAITAGDDPPTAVGDSGATNEDSPLDVPAPGVLENDTDPDPGDTKTVVRLNGSLTLSGTSAEGAAVTIDADGSYTYDPGSLFQGLSSGQTDVDSFTYTMVDATGAQATATVNLTIAGVPDAPTGVADTFHAIGNTGLFVGTTRPAGEAGRVTTGSVLANDTDPDTPNANLVVEPVTNASTTLGGTITIEADGHFSYHPDDGDTGVTDTFTYRVCDASPCHSGTVANDTGTLNLAIAGQVWYVRNNAAAGGDGTSDGPFDTLAEAETASSTGDSVYVFDGDNTAANLGTGYLMETSERLIGEHAGISLDPDGIGPLGVEALHEGTPTAHPTLTTNAAEDVVTLASGSTVDGLNLDPGGAGGGIGGGPGAGGPAAANVTIARVNVVDGGAPGTQPGLDLDGTTGSSNVSNLVVSNGGSPTAIGVRLSNAGIVRFASAGTTSITTVGAKGLDASGTNMGTSTFDDITVTGSGSGGVSMVGTTGTTGLGDGIGTDLALTTTSGVTPAFSLSGAGTVAVAGAGADNVSATGGPAIDVTGTPGAVLGFDDVDSTNSAGDGINLSGTGTFVFSAATGEISGAGGLGFDLDGGSGPVSYGGVLGNGSGQTAEITGRTGGAVTLSGAVADSGDAGGGISLSGNTGGTTTFSNASKALDTGAGDAVVMSSSDGHALTLSSGGLDIDTTSGVGVDATNSGTLVVSGSGNTIQTTTGRALHVSATDIGTGGLNFQSIASNGATNGINLSNTGSTGGLSVNGNGGSCTSAATCTGGAIQNSTDAGIALTGVGGDVSLTRMSVNGGGDDGVRATTVGNGIALSNSRIASNGGAIGAATERGLDYLNVTGSSSIASTDVTGSWDTNARVENTGTGSHSLWVSSSKFNANDASFGAHGFELRGDGSATVNVSVTNSQFHANRDTGFVMTNESGGSPTMNLDFHGNSVQGGNPGSLSGRPGLVVAPDGGAQTKVAMSGNAVAGTSGSAVILNPLPLTTAAADSHFTFEGNTIGLAGVPGSGSSTGVGISARPAGDGDAKFLIRNNVVRNYSQHGLQLLAEEGTGGTADFIVRGNAISDPSGGLGSSEGIYLQAGSTPTDDTQVCADVGGASASLFNTFAGTGQNGLPDLGISTRFGTDIQMPGFVTGGDVQAYIRGRNDGLPTVQVHHDPVIGTPTSCDAPTLPQ